ncbi:MAG: beta-lactamase [Pseudomonadota bacterium]|nr:beta-lactamase [Pseudomonadota bacterium]
MSVVSSLPARAVLAQPALRQVVATAVEPVMATYHVPGMAIGVIVGDRSFVFDFGVASQATGRPVGASTLFEIGSISKVFTATLAAWAVERGDLSLSDRVGKYLPDVRARPFGQVSLLDLATHTPGGLPQQVPDDISDDKALMRYYENWIPSYPAGTYRTYSNPGIGALGWVLAAREGLDFKTLMTRQLLPALALNSTYLDVPADRELDYAQGYTKHDLPIRMSADVLWAETYGIKTTAGDLLRFVRANMDADDASRGLGRALFATRTGYYTAGPMTQDLVWEQYASPVTLEALLKGNSGSMGADAHPVTAIAPPLPPLAAAWVNKTGSTNGFGAYVAFVPAERFGVVMLANKNIPIEARVKAAHDIFTAVQHREGPGRVTIP